MKKNMATGKTNKSLAKRLKVTKSGKILARKPNQNHFRAKKSRKSELGVKRLGIFKLSKKDLGQYLPLA